MKKIFYVERGVEKFDLASRLIFGFSIWWCLLNYHPSFQCKLHFACEMQLKVYRFFESLKTINYGNCTLRSLIRFFLMSAIFI